MQKFWKNSKIVEAVQWHQGDQFIGPMRWDSRAAENKPYFLLSGQRVHVSDGDWVVYEAGRYYPVNPAAFKQKFFGTWNWSELEPDEDGEIK